MNLPTETPTLVMCAPDFFAIRPPDPRNGAANQFEIEGYKEFLKDPKAHVRRAGRQHTEGKKLLRSIGFNTRDMDPVEGLHDSPFTADASLSVSLVNGWNLPRRNVTIFSRFTNEERSPEVAVTRNFFEREFPERETHTSPFFTEGFGDNRYDAYRGLLWSGFNKNVSRETAASGRSDIRAHAFLTEATGIEVVSLETKFPYFHTDTSIGPLSKGHVLCFEGGLQPESYQRFLWNAFDRFGLPREDYLIKVSTEDAKRLACNTVCLGDEVAIPLCSQELQDSIRRAGYNVTATDLSCFIGAGGAYDCITNYVNQPHIPGGYAGRDQHGAARCG